MRMAILGLAALGLGGPLDAAVIHSVTVASSGGTANTFDALPSPQALQTGSTWVTVSQGRFDSGHWQIGGERSVTSWEPFGETDENGEFVPALVGNDYGYSPVCESNLAVPVCGTVPLRTMLAHNIFHIDFRRPADYFTCTLTYVVAGVCGEFYTLGPADFDLYASNVTGDVTFTFFDANPVPEPATWALLLIGFGMTGTMQRRRTAAASFS